MSKLNEFEKWYEDNYGYMVKSEDREQKTKVAWKAALEYAKIEGYRLEEKEGEYSCPLIDVIQIELEKLDK